MLEGLFDERLGDEATRRRWYDVTAFRRVSCNIPGRTDLCHYGNAGRATFDTPGVRNLDFSAYKNFSISETMKVQFRAESFNVTNHVNLGLPVADLNSANFGRVFSAGPPRLMQFALRLMF